MDLWWGYAHGYAHPLCHEEILHHTEQVGRRRQQGFLFVSSFSTCTMAMRPMPKNQKHP